MILKSVAIEPTNKCNLNCVFCHGSKREKGFMSLNLFQEIIKDLSKFKGKIRLGLSQSGEPSIHPYFSRMLHYALKTGFSVTFSTNATLLHRIKDAENSKLHIQISLSHDDPEIIKEIDRFLLIRKCEAHISYVRFNQSEKEHLDFIERWKPKIDYIVSTPFINEECSAPIPRQVNKFCYEPFRTLVIQHNGDITTCCHDRDGLNVIGNIKNSSILRFWLSPIMSKIRAESVLFGKPKLPLCEKCELWKGSLHKVYYS